MKIIVIEGTDNTGKDTLINNLLNKYKDKKCKVIHCERPIHTDNRGAQIEQDYKFLSLIDGIKNNKHDCDILIYNRSWYGEFVYGCIYRGRKKLDTIRYIWYLEEQLTKYDITYIQLLSSNIKLLLDNDDNNSLSNKNGALIMQEYNYFKDIFKRSGVIKKKMIMVNDQVTGIFKSKEEILKESIEIINKKITDKTYVKVRHDF